MSNLQRLEMETMGVVELGQSEAIVYLEENELKPCEEDKADSATSKKKKQL